VKSRFVLFILLFLFITFHFTSGVQRRAAGEMSAGKLLLFEN